MGLFLLRGFPIVVVCFFQRLKIQRKVWFQFAAQGIKVFEPPDFLCRIMKNTIMIAFFVCLFQFEKQNVFPLDDG